MGIKPKLLFGGDLKWNASDWTASDDRVRGGKSQSYLTPIPTDTALAEFHGHLDITALGAAGFASQRTTSATTTWDLSAYDGINLSIEDGDEKMYTFILKDELLDPDPESGRERASVNWEVDFRVPERKVEEEEEEEEVVVVDGKGRRKEGRAGAVYMPWKDFKPTYRGREMKDVEKPIDLESIRRVSLMTRSFFGTQEGDFSLTLRSIEAVTVDKEGEDGCVSAEKTGGDGEDQCSDPDPGNSIRKRSEELGGGMTAQQQPSQSWLQWIWARCFKR
ncbi:hypothetical protein GJ744_000414 [Endocarpon pusillum]|uniref:NADH:ubiquinone oxidoreductase intermediate-associated protein 30 domain-containing protein n=1 Tax=Endocarpon pusillum TaxID=364733 RepID=A0A8H7E095_9EURO|nr:hypothetical protein GJ744_000414 [Endocarpon pusillum]